MKKIEIKNRYDNEVVFFYECENNTILKTLLRAIKSNADLRNADLCNADLRNADLCNADLRNADLCNADLCNADLRYADLRNANLRYADLCNADLRYADLRNADLRDAIRVPLYCKWSLGLSGTKISIGCKTKTIEEWDLFFDSNEEFETKRNTDEFKQIEACYNAYKSYYEILNK